MRSVVVGFGSIGQRHSRILKTLGSAVAVVTSQTSNQEVTFSSIQSALRDFEPDYIVIASPTSRHKSDLEIVLESGYEGVILVEKPLFSTWSPTLKQLANRIAIGYNLRFLEPIQMLRHLLIGQRVVAVEFINVEYLPNWRPNRDYRSTTSAQRQLGGGVLRDLSHELDFMHYLFGAPSKAFAVVDNHQILEIDTEDSVHAIVHVDPDITATLHLSYLNRVRRRTIDVTTSEMTIHCDLLSGKVLVNGDPTQLQVDRDTTFERMHEAVYAGDMDIACTFQQGVEVLRTIDMIETSNALGAWVMR